MAVDPLIPATKVVTENAKLAPAGSDWLHVKSGGTYRVLTHVLQESDLVPVVIYQATHGDTPYRWSRPAVDFLDGRFQQIPSGPLGKLKQKVRRWLM